MFAFKMKPRCGNLTLGRVGDRNIVPHIKTYRVIIKTFKNKCFELNVNVDICLRSRPGSPDVVRSFVPSNVENDGLMG